MPAALHTPCRFAVLQLACGIVLSLVLCLANRAAIAQEKPAAAPPEIEFRPNVEYGTAGEIKLTLNLAMQKPGDALRPAILYIHGGGWAAGNKDQLNEAIKLAAKQGYVAVTIGYRFAPQHVFPAQVEDVKCAARWLRAHAGELKLDPERLGAIGFSAGAHLSMMLGTMDKEDGFEGEGGWPDQSSKVQAVVSYFGPTNFVSEYPEITRGIVKRFIGGTQTEKLEQYRKASPVTYVDKRDAPMLLFQGTEDLLVPYEQAFQMTRALTDAKVPGRVEFLIGAHHGWGGKEVERTQREAMSFFDQWLKPAK